jgi:hypothetical protein
LTLTKLVIPAAQMPYFVKINMSSSG